MANLIEHLTSVSPGLRSGPSPGRRALALALSVMLVLASTLPAVAFAGEADSEGIGTAPPVEAPGAANFDPGGEEAGLEDAPATGGAEEGAVEVESEADLESPAPTEVTSTIGEGEVEESQPQPEEVPSAPAPVSEPEPVQQAATEPAPSEPVANTSLAAPKQKTSGKTKSSPAATTSTEPSEEEAPSSPAPQPEAAPPVDSGRSLAGKRFYTVQPGDCLSYIAAARLGDGADTVKLEEEVERLWLLNEDRIGTGDPDLIYPGTVLRLH
jgi:nucleoid-associated protein YgaU